MGGKELKLREGEHQGKPTTSWTESRIIPPNDVARGSWIIIEGISREKGKKQV